MQLKCGDGRKLLVAVGRSSFRRARPFQEGRPFQRGRALVAYLIGRGLKPLQEVW